MVACDKVERRGGGKQKTKKTTKQQKKAKIEKVLLNINSLFLFLCVAK